MCDVARLPVRSVVSASHFVTDLTVGLGEVVFDYLKDSLSGRARFEFLLCAKTKSCGLDYPASNRWNQYITAEASPWNASWLPMIVIAVAQILMSFNINALRVSIGGIGASFGAPPTTVGTAIVTHSLFIAGFVMTGAKVGAQYGPASVFRVTVVLFGVEMATMAASPTATVMIFAQGIAGAAAAALVPTLVVLITTSYEGRQQAKAFGWLGAAEAAASVLAF